MNNMKMSWRVFRIVASILFLLAVGVRVETIETTNLIPNDNTIGGVILEGSPVFDFGATVAIADTDDKGNPPPPPQFLCQPANLPKYGRYTWGVQICGGNMYCQVCMYNANSEPEYCYYETCVQM